MLDRITNRLWIVKAISKLKLSTQSEIATRLLTSKKKYVTEEGNANLDDILKCALCPNMCRFDCPVLQAAKSETYSPSGRARIAYLMERGRYKSDAAAELMYACAGCEACKQWCPFGFSVEDLLIGVRKDLNERGLTPPHLKRLKDDLAHSHTVYRDGVKSLNRGPREADTLYFAGCTTLNRMDRVAHATMKIMDRSGVNYDTLPEEWCCGAPLKILGYDDAFEEFERHNTEMIKGYGTLVCSCPTCVHTFRMTYRGGLSKDVEILHTSEYLLRLVRDGTVRLKRSDREVVFHDPCSLSRRLGIHGEPRDLLKRIPGLTLNETQLSKEATRCCGKGGLLGSTDPELSNSMARDRLADLKAAGGSIVTACPSCELAFKEAGGEALDISEVVLESME